MSTSGSSQDKNEPEKLNGQKDDQIVFQEAIFLEMLDSYQDAIFRFLYFRVSSRAVALDITQDTFTKIWKYLVSGKQIEYPEAFIYRAAKNALIDYYKKEKPLSLDGIMESGFDPASTKDTDEILRQDDIAGVKILLDGLNAEENQIIYLRFTEEKPIEEIANLFGKSTNAMTVKIHRLIKKLRETYEKQQNG